MNFYSGFSHFYLISTYLLPNFYLISTYKSKSYTYYTYIYTIHVYACEIKLFFLLLISYICICKNSKKVSFFNKNICGAEFGG
jgi:hypothetical protein